MMRGLAAAFALALSVVCRPAWADATCAPRVALVIGNAAYPDSDAVLPEPLGNARATADALGRIGFSVTEADDLTQEKMQAALTAFEDKVTKDAVALLFFSGFGVQAGGHTYLLPVDARIWTEADVKTAGINVDRIVADLGTRGAKLRLVVIDAARRNPFERRFRPAGSQGLAPVVGAPGLLALYSDGPGAVLTEGSGPTSPFADALVRAMTASGAMAESAFRRTQADVFRLSHAGQKPWVSSFLDADAALGCKGARPAVAAEVAPRAVLPPPPAPVVDSAPRPAPDLVPARQAMPEEQRPTPSPPASRPVEPLPPEAARATPSVPTPPDTTSSDDSAVVDTPRLEEVRDRLFEQGLNPGETGTPEMADAIRAYQATAGLGGPARPTLGLLRALRAAPSLAPWGAISFARGAKQWGMAYSAPSRRQSLADARARCASDECVSEVTFHSGQCGAFALSSANWSMTWRSDAALARHDAIGLCEKRGPACRIIGAVCADGSERVPHNATSQGDTR